MLSSHSINSYVPLGADLTLCSTHVGWNSVLLREFRNPLCVDEYTTAVTPDLRIVLITAGSPCIQFKEQGDWRENLYRAGCGGVIAPGEATQLRWKVADHHRVLQAYIPGTILTDVSQELFGRQGRSVGSLQCFVLNDAVVSTTLVSLGQAARALAPDMHAETTAHFLVSYLLLRQSRLDRQRFVPKDQALNRVEDYMHEHLSRSITLGELADVAGVSRFQLLRMAKSKWGETPQRYLTRLRMQLAQRLLMSKRMTVIEISLECGYGNPGHFAKAFHRLVGVSPSEFSRLN